MQHTIDELWQIKAKSDECLTAIIEKNKKDETILQKMGSGEGQKRPKVEDEGHMELKSEIVRKDEDEVMD